MDHADTFNFSKHKDVLSCSLYLSTSSFFQPEPWESLQ